MGLKLTKLSDLSAAIAATRSRLKKRALLAACLREAPPLQVALAVSYIAGQLPQGRIGLGPAIVRHVARQPAADRATLTLAEVDRAFSDVAATTGQGSKQARTDILGRLFARATGREQDFLCRLILGELRQGALDGVIIDAVADAAGLGDADVRRAFMLAGNLADVADAAMRDGAAGLDRFRLEPLLPVRPMLAQPADGIADAMAGLGTAALEYKLDGARVQVHRAGDEVRIFSRRLNDVTESLPEIVDAVRALPLTSAIFDGEVIALRDDGRPHPFQVTMRRFGRKTDVERMRESLPVDVFLFDCLYRDGESLIDRATRARHEALANSAGSALLVPRLVTDSSGEARDFLAGALAAGHEGIMAKALDLPYEAGNRGAGWLKIKQAHTLDLVVLAAEWGSGRREGRLSNLHLGARDEDGTGFVMLGKTFKGLTDRMLEWQTRELLEREIGREGHVVHVRPELVVEIAVNEIQASSQYPAGMALRFARVKRYRNDKIAGEADTLDAVRDIFAAQSGSPSAAAAG